MDLVLLQRMDSEEFAVLLPETERALAVEVAERLRVAIAEEKLPLEGGSHCILKYPLVWPRWPHRRVMLMCFFIGQIQRFMKPRVRKKSVWRNMAVLIPRSFWSLK